MAQPRSLAPLVFLGSLAFIAALVMVVAAEDWGPLFIYLPLLAVLALVLYRRGIKPVDPYFSASLFGLALLLKLLSSIFRYWTVVDLYNYAADGPYYHFQGEYLAAFFQQWDFSILDHYQFRGEGTTNVVVLTALFYTVLPASFPGIFLLFAGLAFGGSVLFYRSFQVGFPQARPTLYRWIVFFLPSILFWPSSLGKEAWLFFCSGWVAYGLVSFIRRRAWFGLVLAGSGLYLISLIRPHFTAFMVLAIGGAYLFSLQKMGGRWGIVAWLVGGTGVIGLTMLALSSGSSYLRIEELSLQEVEASYAMFQDNTLQGGSQFTPANIFTPPGLVYGIITVLFRPFPWEANNAQMMVSALEASVWLVLCWKRRLVFWERLRSLTADPWLAFVALYSLLLIIALTTFGNFGILARQRTLLLPFFWMLFA